MTFDPGPPWQKSDDISLGGSQVHLWLFSVQSFKQPHLFMPYLHAEELERARDFRFQHLRNRFLVRRGVLRHILAQYLHKKPADIRFLRNSFGKPAVIRTSGEINFSVSHSKELILLALTIQHPVGADIQYHEAGMNMQEIARRFFSGREIRQLESIRPNGREAAFYRYWTGKEAYIKALGAGLSYGLDRFFLLYDQEKRCMEVVDSGQKPDAAWRVWPVPVPAKFSAAVAVHKCVVDFKYYLLDRPAKVTDVLSA